MAGATPTTKEEGAEIKVTSHDVAVVQRADLPETHALLADTDAITSSTELHMNGRSDATHKIPRKPVPSRH